MPSDSGHASEFRRTLAEATSKVESIIDAAENTANEIRTEAQADADAYRAKSKREVDSEMSLRSRRIEELTRPLVERVETLRQQARDLSTDLETTLAKLRQAAATNMDLGSAEAPVAEAEASSQAAPAITAEAPAPVIADQAAEPSTPEPAPAPPQPDELPAPAEPPAPTGPPVSTDPEPEAPPAREPFRASSASGSTMPAPVAYPGTGAQAPEPAATEAELPPASSVGAEEPMLRATQLAVAGKSRPEIADALRAEFDLADVDSVLDGILGPE